MNEQIHIDNDDHLRTVVHIQVDYFYIQVESHRDPSLCNKPIAIQQNDAITTTNYEARECGIKRTMSVQEALNLCPHLVLLNRNAESFHNYRQLSYSITAHLQKYSTCVERLGLDENYVDISEVIQQRLGEKCTIVGEVYNKSSAVCLCGCYDRLKLATKVVGEIRESIKNEFKLVTRAGIAQNKLLAKLASDLHKPDRQTVVFPPNGYELIANLSIQELPGLSKSVLNVLEHEMGIRTVADLRYNDKLVNLPKEKAKYLRDLSMGVDASPVKGRFVSLEDSPRTGVESEVKEILEQLLKRLIALVNKDGRIPRRIELLVRKYDDNAKISHKEVKYFNLHPKLFISESKMCVNEDAERKLLSIAMKLFLKAIDVSRPYHITLLGLSFRRFREPMRVCRTAAMLVNPLLKEKVEVQTVTSIESKCDYSAMFMDTSCGGYHYNYNGYSDNTDGSESEMEPSPKKKKFNLIRSARCFKSECPSPSKLNVDQLRINSES
ncbi:DNA polymerase iota [Atheta coriaria]|uniref:DNA polymerase iota n=1 Tax=Dalotia coriaria TaxID=877792 RepID=UPI0031F3F5B8